MTRGRAGVLAAAAAATALLWLVVGTGPDLPERPRASEDWSGDFRSYYLPNAEFAARRLASGQLPLWNPQQGLGAPFLATLQAGVFYPPNALHALLPSPAAFVVLAAAHLALAVVLAGLLAGAFGAGALGSAVAGVAYGASLQVVVGIWSPPVLYTVAWAPGVLLAVDRVIAGPSVARGVALAGVVALSLLAGWAYAFAIVALGAALYAGGLLAAGALRGRGSPLRALAVLALGGLAGVALAAPQLLPTAELLSRSVRALGSLVEGQAVFVDRPHDPALFWRALSARGLNDAVPGILTLPLALLALLLPGAGRARVAALLGVGLLGLMVSFPNHLPVYGWLRELPVLADFRFPYRYRLLTGLALAVAAGVGTTRLQGSLARFPRGAQALGVALVLACLATIALPSFRSVSRFARAVDREPALVADLRESGVAWSDDRTGRIYWTGLGPKLHGLAGTYTVHDMEPMTVAQTARILTFFETGRPRTLLSLPHDITGEAIAGDYAASPFYGHLSLPRGPERAAILDLLSVETIVTADPPDWLDTRYERVSSANAELAVFENSHALPRAYRVPRAVPEPAGAQAALRRLLAPRFDPRVHVMLAAPPPALVWRPGEARPVPGGSVAIEAYEPERVVLTTRGSEPGVVVLTDAWFPGWEATLDGSPVRVRRANFALRGVVVPAGEHRIEMRYRPQPLRAGFGVAALAAVGCVAALFLARRMGPGD